MRGWLAASAPGVFVGRVVSADATTAVQKAMDSAARSGRPLLLDPITYTCGPLVVPNGLVMVAPSPSGYGASRVEPHAKIELAAGSNDHLLRGAEDVAHVRLTGVHFDGNKNNNILGDVIHLDDTEPQEAQWHIRDCVIESGASYGVYVGNGRRCVQISDSTINYNRLVGVRLNGSDAHIDRCIVGSNGEAGIGVGGTVCDVHACDIYNNGIGIVVYSTLTKVTIRANRVDKHVNQGLLISAQCRDIIVTNNIFHSNVVDVTDVSNSTTVVMANNIYGTE